MMYTDNYSDEKNYFAPPKQDSEINGINSPERAILIALGDKADEELEELEELCHTAGIVVVQKYSQRQRMSSPLFCGEGKAYEIRQAVDELDATLVIADGELTPSQTGTMERFFNVKVLDRTAIILDIFASRAKSNEGKLQVELAQLQYLYARLAGSRADLSRLGGGIGTRGPGEKQLETDRRHIRRRMQHISEELKLVEKRRAILREQRREKGYKTVALVGYTNAGKSTLLTALTGSQTYADNILFATLDPLTRAMPNDKGLDILVTDTVGFIKKLPHSLIEAFKSTLEESLNADLILNVIDSSSNDYPSQLATTEDVLIELKAQQPRINVYNKCDKIGSKPMFTASPCVFISAKTGDGIEALRELICHRLFEDTVTLTLDIPYEKSAVLSELYENAKIISTEYTDTSARVKVMLPSQIRYKYRQYEVIPE
ncbi:MAG: GTPase HflX [Clostridiales bacterium]|nr:GTPase HflX [Clostridiales bacterium]